MKCAHCDNTDTTWFPAESFSLINVCEHCAKDYAVCCFCSKPALRDDMWKVRGRNDMVCSDCFPD